MDTIKNKKPLSLDKVLVSYNALIGIIVAFIVLLLVLLGTNKNGFNKYFGYEILITAPILFVLAILIKEFIAFKNNSPNSYLYKFPQASEKWFTTLILLIIGLIGIFGVFMVLYVGGIFSDSPPENNIAMIINFIFIISFIIIAALIYNSSKSKDDNVLNFAPTELRNMFNLRTKYTFFFAIFILFVTLLYFYNPWDIMTSYGGPVLFFSLFVGIIMVIMITIYQYFLSNSSSANILTPGPMAFVAKSAYILSAIGISFGLIYGLLKLMGVFNQDASKPETWGHFIFNILMFSAMLGIIYKLANAGGFLDKNPYYRLILNTLLYIPCILVTFINKLSQLFGLTKGSSDAFTPPKPFEIKILVLSLILLISYFLWFFLGKKMVQSAYLKRGGKQLINQPISTNVLTNVASYQSLSGSDKFKYQYALSFWVYLDAFPPSTNSSYNKVVSLLSYGENPMIKYSSANNTLYITVKPSTIPEANSDVKNDDELTVENIDKWKQVQTTINEAIENVKSMTFTDEKDADGNRIIYKHPDVQLQKWNNIVINYNGGTLDVFYNGRLVKSAIEVVPYMKFDMLTVGTENGVMGNVANLMYFDHPLNIVTINTLYSSLKDKNPPVISENKESLISV